MAEISYDGQSVAVGGRRVWLVSGTVHYARVPHQLWRSRIRAAAQAGLNTIDTYVFWNLHEQKPGQFSFEGDLDLRRFIQIVGQEKMHCILRPGPYVGSQWDFGGLPAWLQRIDGIGLRQSSGPFMEATARYIGAVLEQVKDLQVSTGGPIHLMAAENRWFCDNPQQAQSYLLEICRYLRENGCTVPIVDCNNLWSTVDGTIGCWTGQTHLAADLRQLRVVQPRAPRMLLEYEAGSPDTWATARSRPVDAQRHMHRLASVLAMGAQYNIWPFHGGTNHAFFAGRSAASRFAFTTTSHDCDAPLAEAGGRGPKYLTTKRLSVFASQFDQLFAHLNADGHHAALAVGDDHQGLSVVHQTGQQGDVVFLFKNTKDHSTDADILLPDGLTLPVPIGADPVAWFVLNTDLGGVAKLNFTNLRPWAFLHRRALVLFGPAGAEGLICVNGALLRVRVPAGRTPLVQPHENLTVIVLNTEQVDAAYLHPDGVVVGAAGLDDDDQPIALNGWAQVTTIRPNGQMKRQRIKPLPRRGAPRLLGWKQADLTSMINGTDESFEPIGGPASLEAMKCDYGYGWYRVCLNSPVAGNMLAPEAADRIHLFQKGRLAGILGPGPGAVQGPTRLRLTGTVVVLADNLGRLADGWGMGESKGLWGHFYTVKPARLGQPRHIRDHRFDLFQLGGFFPFAHGGHQTLSDAVAWKVRPIGHHPLVLEIDQWPWRTVVMVNDAPVGAYDPDLNGGFARLTLPVGDRLHKGTNELKLALDGTRQSHPIRAQTVARHLRLYQATATATAKASWAFAAWNRPRDTDFQPIRKNNTGQPRWYICRFNVKHIDTPLWLEPVGMTKGQFYINGHNAGRYFVDTHTGQAVGPQKRYYLPEPWLRTDGPNELMLFDEHGRSPVRCRLAYDAMGPYGH